MMMLEMLIIAKANIISSSDSAPIPIVSGLMYFNASNQTHAIEWDAAWAVRMNQPKSS